MKKINSSQVPAVVERTLAWYIERLARLENAKRSKAEIDTECTFQPKLCSEPPQHQQPTDYSKLNSRSIEQFLTRYEIAKSNKELNKVKE